MRIVITGDKSRYQFLRYMVGEQSIKNYKEFYTTKMGENDIYLTPDSDKVSEYTYYTNKLPLHTEIYFPKESEELTLTFDFSDRVIVFDEFPYGTEEDIRKLESLMESGSYGQLEVVLFQNDRTRLDTDITTDTMAVDEAEGRYRKKYITVQRYQNNHRPDFLFWSVTPSGRTEQHIFSNLLAAAQKRIDIFESSYELDYIFELSGVIEDPKILDSFVKYGRDLEGKNVWNIFGARAYVYFFQESHDIDQFCIREYRKNIEDLSIWNMEKDLDDLKERIRKLFAEKMKVFDELIYNYGEDVYVYFINGYQNRIINFKKRIKRFFEEDLKVFLKDRLTKHVERMEKLIR